MLCVFVDEWLYLLEGGEEKFRTAVLVQDVAIFLGKHHSRTISFPLLKASRLIVHHQEQKLECPQNLKCSRVSSQRKRERGSTGGGEVTEPWCQRSKSTLAAGGAEHGGSRTRDLRRKVRKGTKEEEGEERRGGGGR